MTSRQAAEFKRLKLRNRYLERRHRGVTKARLDRLIWLLEAIETVCDKPHERPLIRVSRADAKLLRPLVEALVNP